MPSKTKSNYVITTKDALENEFLSNNWEARLNKCRQVHRDKDFEFVSDTRPYRRQHLVEHYEGDDLIAFSIDYILHDGSALRRIKMLKVNGIRLLVP